MCMLHLVFLMPRTQISLVYASVSESDIILKVRDWGEGGRGVVGAGGVCVWGPWAVAVLVMGSN